MSLLVNVDGPFHVEPPVNVGHLADDEARTLYVALRRRFGEACTQCERLKAFDAKTAELLAEHAGLLAIARLEWPRLLNQLGDLGSAANFVARLAQTPDEYEVAELADEMGLEI